MKNITVELRHGLLTHFYTMCGESQKEVEQYVRENMHEFRNFIINPRIPLEVIPHEEGFKNVLKTVNTNR